MEDLWNYCNARNWNQKTKIQLFLTMNTLLFAAVGLLA